MTKKTITIQEALRAIKLTEKKIAATNQAGLLVAVSYKDKAVVGNTTSLAKFNEQARANFQSNMDLIKYYHELKGKVAEKNALTEISIAGRKMSVSAAIEYKTSLVLERSMLDKLRSEYARAVKEMQLSEQKLQQDAENAATAMFSGTAMTPERKSSDEYRKVIEDYKAARAVSIADPVKAEEEIKKLQDFIDDFDAEIDNLLTLSNVNTTIELD